MISLTGSMLIVLAILNSSAHILFAGLFITLMGMALGEYTRAEASNAAATIATPFSKRGANQ